MPGTLKKGHKIKGSFFFHKETAGCPPKKENQVEEFDFGTHILLLNLLGTLGRALISELQFSHL